MIDDAVHVAVRFPVAIERDRLVGDTNVLDQFRDDSRITVLSPPQFKTGELIWPYAKARE